MADQPPTGGQPPPPAIDTTVSHSARIWNYWLGGKHLALADSINVGEAHKEAGRRYEEGGAVPYHLRSPEQIAGFFHGLTLVDPGVVPVSRWRPDPSPFGLPGEVESLAGVARKPFLVT